MSYQRCIEFVCLPQIEKRKKFDSKNNKLAYDGYKNDEYSNIALEIS